MVRNDRRRPGASTPIATIRTTTRVARRRQPLADRPARAARSAGGHGGRHSPRVSAGRWRRPLAGLGGPPSDCRWRRGRLASPDGSRGSRRVRARGRARSTRESIQRSCRATAEPLQTQRQFMADASHELRTPVSVIRSAADVTLGRDHRDEREYREALSIVGDQARRVSRLVEDMLVLARADAGGYPLQRAHMYIDELVADCARTVALLAESRGVAIHTSAACRVFARRRRGSTAANAPERRSECSAAYPGRPERHDRRRTQRPNSRDRRDE